MKPLNTKFFQTKILDWFRVNKRDLPWRRTKDPYKILVSEVMLQQTQVSRGLVKYPEFLKHFPTLKSLADAPAREVLLAWQGMGYNRRALNLQKSAQKVMREFGGKFPSTAEEIRSLPGVGVATTGSLLAFAFGRDVSSLDINIKRVLHRFFAGSEFPDWSMKEKELAALGNAVVPKGRGPDWSQALMDFGSVVCTARRPLCEACPLRTRCLAYPNILRDVKTKRKGWNAVEPAPASAPEIPNRIFRGRVVEALRGAPAHRLKRGELSRIVKTDYSEDDSEWFAGILKGLERDGMIRLAGHGETAVVSLI